MALTQWRHRAEKFLDKALPGKTFGVIGLHVVTAGKSCGRTAHASLVPRTLRL